MFDSYVVEVCRLVLQPLYDTHHRLPIILKMLKLAGLEFLAVRKDRNHWSNVRAIEWMMIKHLPAELLPEMF